MFTARPPCVRHRVRHCCDTKEPHGIRQSGEPANCSAQLSVVLEYESRDVPTLLLSGKSSESRGGREAEVCGPTRSCPGLEAGLPEDGAAWEQGARLMGQGDERRASRRRDSVCKEPVIEN